MPMLILAAPLLLAGIAFVVLFVVLSVPLWISFLVAGGLLGVSLLFAGGTVLVRARSARHESHRQRPAVVSGAVQAPIRVPGVALSGGGFVIMYAAIGIPLWVSILAAGVLLGIYSALTEAIFLGARTGVLAGKGPAPVTASDGHEHKRPGRVSPAPAERTPLAS